MGTNVESPGAFRDFDGDVAQYTEALGNHRAATLTPELVKVQVLYVADQTDIQKLQITAKGRLDG